MTMRKISAAACLLLAASGARAQLSSVRTAAAPTARTAPAALSVYAAAAASAPALIAPALAAPAFPAAPCCSAVPVLDAPSAPMLPAVPTLAAGAAAAPAQEKGKAPAAAALAEFSRLVADLMSGDAARSEAATAGLNRLKDAHLDKGAALQSAKILDLKPMQIAAGMYEVQDKAQALRALKGKDLDKWLRDKSVPFIEDYKGRKRPVDHHHEARAAWEAGLDQAYARRYFDAELHRRIKALSRDEYYAVTRAMGLFYDRDQFGVGPHDPNHLPEDVRGLADDPYRSVAWQVRKRGGYDKSSVPFAEFQWAQFFRERVKIYPTRADFEKAVAEAMRIVHDRAARSLPGYRPK